jgi:Interferon-induced transmembrane protein/GYF domain 2
MQWFYSSKGTQAGPVEEAEILSKIASGEISPTDQVWRDGMANWLPAAQVPELNRSGGHSQAVSHSPYQSPAAQLNPYSGAPITNYLWQSIVVTLCCCWPVGIPAIVNAAKVESLVARGDIQGAMAASASAKRWCWISVALWGVFIVGVLAFSTLSAIVAR